MKKKLFFIAAFILFAQTQVFCWDTDFSLGLGASGKMYPEGDIGAGGYFQIECFVSKWFSLSLRLGAFYSGALTLTGGYARDPVIATDMDANIRIYINAAYTRWFSVFLQAGGGVLVTFDIPDDPQAEPTWGGGLGFRIFFSDNFFFEIAGRYGMPFMVDAGILIGCYAL